MKNTIYLAALLIIILVLSCTKSRAEGAAQSQIPQQQSVAAAGY